MIGATAGLSEADDAGRRYLIGVAAAVQLAMFPAWLGAVTVAGMPGPDVVRHNLLGFPINLMTISLTALLAYAALHSTPEVSGARRAISARADQDPRRSRFLLSEKFFLAARAAGFYGPGS